MTPTSDSAIKPRKQQDKVEAIGTLSATRRRSLVSNETGRLLAIEKKSNHSMLENSRRAPSAEAISAKNSVFHGISNVTVGRSGHHAHRTGDKRPYTPIKVRSLRHLNNVRKAGRREPAPDVSQIRLRSLTEWAESAPANTNLQLPPVSASRTSWIGGEKQARGEATQIHAEGPVSDLAPNMTAHNDLGRAQSSVLSGEKAMTIPSRVDLHASPEKRLRTFANGRFVYFPGEFLANLKFGRAEIGDVRVGGLPSWAIGYVIKLKSAGQLRLEIGSNDVITPAQWAQLCTGRSNALQPTGVIIPYADTESAVSEMEQYLHQHNLAALWYHPTEDFMLVLYSPRSTAWLFLERVGGLPIDSNIRVLTRNKMPPTETLAGGRIASANNNHPRTDEQPRNVSPQTPHSLAALTTTSDRNPASAVNKSDKSAMSAAHSRRGSRANGPDAANSTSDTAKGAKLPGFLAEPAAQLSSRSIHTFENGEHDSVLHDPSENDAVNLQIDVPEAEPHPFQLSLQPGQTLGQAFWNAFQISYDHLTAVPPSKNVDRSPAKARFYLVYPAAAQRELACLQNFLRSNTYQTNICTSMEERAWEAFQNIYKGDYIGVILVC